MPDDRNYYLETLGRIEQDIAAIDLTAAAASVSISLRRIADAVEEADRLLMVIADKLEAIEMSTRRVGR